MVSVIVQAPVLFQACRKSNARLAVCCCGQVSEEWCDIAPGFLR